MNESGGVRVFVDFYTSIVYITDHCSYLVLIVDLHETFFIFECFVNFIEMYSNVSYQVLHYNFIYAGYSKLRFYFTFMKQNFIEKCFFDVSKLNLFISFFLRKMMKTEFQIIFHLFQAIFTIFSSQFFSQRVLIKKNSRRHDLVAVWPGRRQFRRFHIVGRFGQVDRLVGVVRVRAAPFLRVVASEERQENAAGRQWAGERRFGVGRRPENDRFRLRKQET